MSSLLRSLVALTALLSSAVALSQCTEGDRCPSHPQVALDGVCAESGRCVDDHTLQPRARIIYSGPCSDVPANDPYITNQVCATCSGGVCVDQGTPTTCPSGTVCRDHLPAADGGSLSEARCVAPDSDAGGSTGNDAG